MAAEPASSEATATRERDRSSHTVPYHLGYASYLRGEPLRAPDGSESRDRDRWADGWLEAQRVEWADSPGRNDDA